MEKAGIVVVSKGGSSYKKILSYLDANAQTDVLRVDTIGEALDVIYAANADILIADMGEKQQKVLDMKPHAYYNTAADARENLNYVCWYINTHYRERLGLKELADMIGVTPNYLCRLFKEEKGVTLSHYIEKIRLRKAAQELVTTDRYVQEISFMIGYRNDSYFSKVFKKMYGLSPAEYREKMRREIKDGEENEDP